MLKKFRNFIILLLFFSSLFSPPLSGESATVSELRQKIESRSGEIEKLEAEIEAYQEELRGLSETASSLKGEITRLETTRKKLAADIQLTEKEIDRADLTIDKLLLDIGNQGETIGQRQMAVQKTLQEWREVQDQNLIEIFLAYDRFSDAWTEISELAAFKRELQTDIASLSEAKTELEAIERATRKEREQLLKLENRLRDQQEIAAENQAEKDQLLKNTKNEEGKYQQMLREREILRAAYLQEIRAIEEELRRLIDPDSLPAAAAGVLAWPVTNPILTQDFGLTEFSQQTDVYKGKGHNGIDFRASVGTIIYAAGGGVVKGTGDTDKICPGGSYGRWIVIDHPNKLSTLYAHLSRISVVPGQTVARGEAIGYSGNTGYTTGPHLHFTVYASDTYREAETNHCGLVPAGGYVNPLDYL